MTFDLLTRRNFSLRLASFFPGLSIAGTAFGSSGRAQSAGSAGEEGVLHTAEAIHQEVVFLRSRKRIYEALTDANFFAFAKQITKVPGDSPTEVSKEVGGTFSIFGGHIVG